MINAAHTRTCVCVYEWKLPMLLFRWWRTYWMLLNDPSITSPFSLCRESHKRIEQMAWISGWFGFWYTFGLNHFSVLEQTHISNTSELMGNHTLDGCLKKNKNVCSESLTFNLSFYSFKPNGAGWCLTTQLPVLSLNLNELWIHKRTAGLTSTVAALAAEAIQTCSSEEVRNYRPRLKWLSTLVPKLFLELLLPGLHRTQFNPIYSAMIPPGESGGMSVVQVGSR